MGLEDTPSVNFQKLENELSENETSESENEVIESSLDDELTPLQPNTNEDTYTVEDAINFIGFGKFQIILSVLGGLCWCADAMELMILSILSPELHCKWHLTSFKQAFITTMVFIGASVSSALWGKLCDQHGRKAGLVLCSIWVFYYGILSALSPSYPWMLILRGLVGFGLGGAPQSVTLYSEFLPSKYRAKCVTLLEVFWATGACFEVALAYFIMPTLGWRWLLGFSAFPVLLFVAACKWIPESVRFHIACGNQDKAYSTLQRVARYNKKPMPPGKLVMGKVQERRGKFSDLFTPKYRVTTVLLLLIWFANAFAYYGIVLLTTELLAAKDPCQVESPDVQECYTDCHTLSKNDYLTLLWTTLAEFPGVLITFLIIDPLGRKKTMCLEFIVFSIFSFLILLCLDWLTTIIFIFIARAFITAAFQATYVYTPEVYPTAVRALGLGLCSGVARIGAIITPFIAQVLLKYSEFAAISTYGGVAILAGIASLLLPRETKGKEMEG